MDIVLPIIVSLLIGVFVVGVIAKLSIHGEEIHRLENMAKITAMTIAALEKVRSERSK